MNILFVSSDFIPHVGGKSTHILDLCDGLKSINVNCEVISLNSVSKFKLLLCKAFLMPFRMLNQDIYIYYFKQCVAKLLNNMVYKYCVSNKVDFISLQDAWAAYSIQHTIDNISIPTALTMHTYFGIENSLDKKTSKFQMKIYEKTLYCETLALGVVGGIITVDDRIKKHVNDVLSAYQEKRKVKYVTSIFNFTNTHKYRIADSDEKTKYRQEYGITDKQFVVSCARRLVEKNGVINLIKAATDIKDKNIIMLIAGDGPQTKTIQKYIIDNNLHDVVKLLGELNSANVRKLYMASDISVVPSITVNGLQEATSISAIEAMACGLPVIASNIGGLKQIIQDNKTGILVDEGNIQQIADSIEMLKSNSEKYFYIRENARKYIEENHSHIESAKKYLIEFKLCVQ